MVDNVHATCAKFGNQMLISGNDTAEHLEEKILSYIQESWIYVYLGLYYDNLQRREQSCKRNYIHRELVSTSTLRKSLFLAAALSYIITNFDCSFAIFKHSIIF